MEQASRDLFKQIVNTFGGCGQGGPQVPPGGLDVPRLKEVDSFFSCHPWLPLVATTSGQRHVRPSSDNSSDSDDEQPEPDGQSQKQRENCVKLWWTALESAQ